MKADAIMIFFKHVLTNTCCEVITVYLKRAPQDWLLRVLYIVQIQILYSAEQEEKLRKPKTRQVTYLWSTGPVLPLIRLDRT